MVSAISDSSQPLSAAIIALQSIYGAPSQAGFGSAVFTDAIKPGADLETIARHYYQHFVGHMWEEYGESAWMSPWKQVYSRPDEVQPDVVAELKAIVDPLASHFMPIMLLAETDDKDRAQQSLANVFNDPLITELKVFSIGDGAAMSGLLLAGSSATGVTTILVSLLD
ncbi:hypothetical protein KQ313_03125 [Synechococcus sp. CS-1325]|uniref:hypothetical protein n=1 Tax=Synechococcus sp. CS-1325 TaxID=2847979 RepID=UPI00223B9132|nr:hypothetical protein [Synechococcus sp. CS-1325]MCT0198677.1 hypothetical protein [Synechococcus sp. CS-1325]